MFSGDYFFIIYILEFCWYRLYNSLVISIINGMSKEDCTLLKKDIMYKLLMSCR